jgi:hypothetical protein
MRARHTGTLSTLALTAAIVFALVATAPSALAQEKTFTGHWVC